MLVLAADTVVGIGRRILPPKRAMPRLTASALSGRGHRVTTGVCLFAEGACVAKRLVTSRVRMKTLDAHDIETYLASGEWQGKAGGYAIQGKAAFCDPHCRVVFGDCGLASFETVAMLSGRFYDRGRWKIMGHEFWSACATPPHGLLKLTAGLSDFRPPRWGKNKPTPPTG